MEELNLLPLALKQKQMGSRRKRRYFLVSFLIILAVFIAFSLPTYLYFYNVNKNKTAELKLSETLILNNKNKKIQTAINVDKLYLSSVDMMTKGKYSTKDNIALFQNFMTKDLYIKTLAYNRQGLQINGSAKNYNSPSEFAANMQLSGKFSEVKLTNVTVSKDGVDYTISIIY